MEVKNYFAFTAENKPIPFCTAYLYEAGTSNLVAGLTDKNGNPIDNPFQADKDGLVQFAGPNGVYDLRFKSSLRDYRIRVSIVDTPALLAAAATAAEAGSQAVESAASAKISEDIALSSNEIYDTTANALSNGVYALDILVAGSGGTDGTYPLAFSGGGGSGAAGWFTVASGAVSAYQITARGAGYTSAPTVSFAAATGLSGASATAVIGANREEGQYFVVMQDSDYSPTYYKVNPGPTAVAILTNYTSAHIDRLSERLRGVIIGTADAWSDIPVSEVDDFYAHKDTGVVTANVNFKYVDIPLLGVESGVRVSSDLSAGVNLCLAAYYDKFGAFISSEQSPGAETAYENFELTIPDGARLIRVTGTEAATISAQQLTVGDLSGRVGEVERGVATLPSVYSSLSDWDAKDYAYVNGGYLTGAVTANANFRHAYYEISEFAQSVRVSGWVESTLSALAIFYDADDNYLGYQERGSGTATEKTNIVLVLPEGTAKIGISSRIAQPAHTVEEFLVAENIASRLRGLEIGGGSITIWGDSTSYPGTSGIGDELAALFPSATVYQQGIGGQQWLDKIQYRLGIAKTTVTIPGGVIPASGEAVTVNLANSILFHNSKNFNAQVMVAGVRCALRYDFATTSNSLEALDDLAEDVAVPAGTTVHMLTGVVEGVDADVTNCVPLSNLLSGIQIVRSVPSINDRFDIDYDAMAVAIEDTLEYLYRHTNRVVLVGMMNGTKDLPDTYTGGQWATEAESYEILAYVRWANDYMRHRAPVFVDAQQNHVDNDGSTTENINGVDFEVLTNTAATPKLSDDRHETEAAQDSTADLIAQKMSDLGWI